MEEKKFLKIAVCVVSLEVANPDENCRQIVSAVKLAKGKGAELVLFSQLCLSSFSCGDLFFNDELLISVERNVIILAKLTKELNIACVVGLPVLVGDCLFNCAAFLADGKIEGFVVKNMVSYFFESFESRWFSSSSVLYVDEVFYGNQIVPIGSNLIFNFNEFKIGLEIGEDLLSNAAAARQFFKAGVDVILNLAAIERTVNIDQYIDMLVCAESYRQHCAYICCFSGTFETSTDSVYYGGVVAFENGRLILKKRQESFESMACFVDLDFDFLKLIKRRYRSSNGKNFENIELKNIDISTRRNCFLSSKKISKTPFISEYFCQNIETICEEVFKIQSVALAKRIKYVNCDNLVIGVSGGLDSALALLVAVESCSLLDLANSTVLGVTMPGFGTTKETLTNAKDLIFEVGAGFEEIDIKPACLQHFKDIGHKEDRFDLVYENSQARERTQILLDIANKLNGLVIGTADMSELAVGFTTFAGDHISMYCVNCGVPKTIVRELIAFKASTAKSEKLKRVLLKILDMPISPELLPLNSDGVLKQKTEELLGDYVLHDFFLFYFVKFGFSVEKIKLMAFDAFSDVYDRDYILKVFETFCSRFFSQQFKRSCLPDGPKVFSFSLSPRSGLKMASDCTSRIWLDSRGLN